MGSFAELERLSAELRYAIGAAQAAEREGQWVEALDGFERSLRLLKDAEHGELASSLLRWIARIYMDGGHLPEADDCLEAAYCQHPW